MPIIARFNGITVKMYLLGKEHGVAHIHAFYDDDVGVFDIKTGIMLEGSLPSKIITIMQPWIANHRIELQSMWDEQRFYHL